MENKLPHFLHVATGLIDFYCYWTPAEEDNTYLGIVYVFLLFPFVLQIIVTQVPITQYVPPSLAQFLP